MNMITGSTICERTAYLKQYGCVINGMGGLGRVGEQYSSCSLCLGDDRLAVGESSEPVNTTFRSRASMLMRIHRGISMACQFIFLSANCKRRSSRFLHLYLLLPSTYFQAALLTIGRCAASVGCFRSPALGEIAQDNEIPWKSSTSWGSSWTVSSNETAWNCSLASYLT